MEDSKCHNEEKANEPSCFTGQKPPVAAGPLDNSPREVLRFLVSDQPQVVENQSLLRERLEQFSAARAGADATQNIAPDSSLLKGDFLLLCAAVQCDIPKQLQEEKKLDVPRLGSLASRLQADSSISPQEAKNAVLAWAYALGLDSSDCAVSPQAAESGPDPGLFSKLQKNEASCCCLSLIVMAISCVAEALLVAVFLCYFMIITDYLGAKPVDPAINSAPIAGQPYTLKLTNDVSLGLLWCPKGSFMMGSPKDELGRNTLYDETQHKVRLTKGFWLGQYEVTQAQYEAVMGKNPSVRYGEERPVDSITWGDAMVFCLRLNNSLESKLPAGYRFSLPTEAQWEYACRAGTSSPLNSGQKLSSEWKVCTNLEPLGWYRMNSGSGPHPVGQKKPNAWGFYDMHGNVSEWCYDRICNYPGAAYKEAVDPTGPTLWFDRFCHGATWYRLLSIPRMARGGSCKTGPSNCRSASRDLFSADGGLDYLGFRLSLGPAI